MHPLATAEEFGKQLKDCAARWIVTVSTRCWTPRGGRRTRGRDRGDPRLRQRARTRSLIDMLASTAPEPVVDIDPAEDVAALPYSSGTTGVPKGVMLTHRQIATNLAQLQPLITTGPGDRVLAVLPFFHIYGLTAPDERPAPAGRHRRRAAALRPGDVPRGRPEPPHHRPVRRPADRAGPSPSTPSSTGTT
ncbi:hypothetical protein GCM10023238_40490 [Streptomyces heliomycini]